MFFVKFVFEITQYINEDQNDAEKAMENITNRMQALKIDE